jgi:hypothetical protein
MTSGGGRGAKKAGFGGTDEGATMGGGLLNIPCVFLFFGQAVWCALFGTFVGTPLAI